MTLTDGTSVKLEMVHFFQGLPVVKHPKPILSSSLRHYCNLSVVLAYYWAYVDNRK